MVHGHPRVQATPRLGLLGYGIIVGILLVGLLSIAVAFVNPKWNAWMRATFSQECIRCTSVGNHCFQPLPFF